MTAVDQLSAQDLVAARTEVAAGRAFTVWFTPAAVGVPAGGSARVVSVGEPAEGDFIQVKPAGSRDTVFCAPAELTRTRPARKRVAAKATAPPAAAPESPGPVSAAVPEPRPTAERADPEPRSAPKPPAAVAPAPKAVAPAPKSVAPVPKAVAPVPKPAAPEVADPAPRRRGPVRPADVTVTLSASVDGDWTVEVVVGKKRTVRPTPVPPADVAKAARALPDEVAEAIDTALEAARRRQHDRVEQLRAELEAAQRALQELTG